MKGLRGIAPALLALLAGQTPPVRSLVGCSSQAPFLVSRGTADLALGVEQPGTIVGDVLVDEWIAAEKLWVSVVREPAAADDAAGRYLSADGTFRLEGLRPGHYTLSVVAPDGPDGIEIARVVGISVEGCETTEDARLQPVDLRGRLFLHCLELVPPVGGELLGGMLGYAPRDDPSGASVPWHFRLAQEEFQGRRIELLSSAPAIDIFLEARGFQSDTLADVSGARRVALRPKLPVRLVLAASAPLPDPPDCLKASLWPLEHRLWFWFNEPMPFDASRSVRLLAPATGRLRVLWTLEGSPRWRINSWPIALGADAVVEVRDTLDEQVFEVGFTAEELAKALEDMRKAWGMSY